MVCTDNVHAEAIAWKEAHVRDVVHAAGVAGCQHWGVSEGLCAWAGGGVGMVMRRRSPYLEISKWQVVAGLVPPPRPPLLTP